MRHISDLTERCPSTALPCSNPPLTNTLESITYHDLQLGWKAEWFKGLELLAGVNNLFGKDPPICLTCSLNGYDASTYDLMGQFFYVRAGLRF